MLHIIDSCVYIESKIYALLLTVFPSCLNTFPESSFIDVWLYEAMLRVQMYKTVWKWFPLSPF